jgi:hypothetical protein
VNETSVVLAKPLPPRVTRVPGTPLAGTRLVSTGGAPTTKLDTLAALPNAFATRMGPVVAPGGTLARSSPSESIAKLAGVPLKVTLLASR